MFFLKNMNSYTTRWLLFFMLCVSQSMLYAKVSGKENELKLSLIIPCHSKHAHHLYNLLRWYEYQTVLPDEVVISLSESDGVPHDVWEELKNERWAFPVTMIYSKNVQYVGQNRNIGCEHAIGDIFLLQDADDLVHHQRVEIVKYLFNRYKLDFLMHLLRGITPDETIEVNLWNDFDAIECVDPKDHREAWKIRGLTNGSIAVARHVFKKFQWSYERRAADIRYNRIIFQHFNKRLVAKAVLQFYRNCFSTKDLDKLAEVTKESDGSKQINDHLAKENKEIKDKHFSVKFIMKA